MAPPEWQAAHLLEVAPPHGAVLHLSEVHVAKVVSWLPLQGARCEPGPQASCLGQGQGWQDTGQKAGRTELEGPGAPAGAVPALWASPLATKVEAFQGQGPEL